MQTVFVLGLDKSNDVALSMTLPTPDDTFHFVYMIHGDVESWPYIRFKCMFNEEFQA